MTDEVSTDFTNPNVKVVYKKIKPLEPQPIPDNVPAIEEKIEEKPQEEDINMLEVQ